jgi:hypothetical protein
VAGVGGCQTEDSDVNITPAAQVLRLPPAPHVPPEDARYGFTEQSDTVSPCRCDKPALHAGLPSDQLSQLSSMCMVGGTQHTAGMLRPPARCLRAAVQWGIGVVFAEALSRRRAFQHPYAQALSDAGSDAVMQIQVQVLGACREIGRAASQEALRLMETCFCDAAQRCTPRQLLAMPFPWG